MYKLPDLPYDYDALKNWVSAHTMEMHHDFHHKSYTTKLNTAVDSMPSELQAKFTDQPIEYWLTHLNELPTEYQTVIRNQGGGYKNHAMFWQMLTPNGDGQPTGELGRAIDAKYDSFANFEKEFETKATGLFGSGWAWLLQDLSIVTTPNQDYPSQNPILGLDVWEHAYYLDYQWDRADYARSWWNHVNWDYVAKRYSDGQ